MEHANKYIKKKVHVCCWQRRYWHNKERGTTFGFHFVVVRNSGNANASRCDVCALRIMYFKVLLNDVIC